MSVKTPICCAGNARRISPTGRHIGAPLIQERLHWTGGGGGGNDPGCSGLCAKRAHWETERDRPFPDSDDSGGKPLDARLR